MLIKRLQKEKDMNFGRKVWLRALLILAFSTLIFAGSDSGVVSAQQDEVSQFRAYCEQGLQEAQKLFQQLEQYEGPKTATTVLESLNEIWITMDHPANLTGLYQAVHPNPEMREVAEEYDQKFSKLATEIQMSRPVYDAVSKVDISSADPKTRRFVEKTLLNFRRAGVDKDPQTREQIKKLQEELVVIGQDFEKNIREDVRSIQLNSVVDLKGLPEDFIQSHQPDAAGKITITTDYPDYLPFISYAESDEYRFELYKKYRSRGYP